MNKKSENLFFLILYEELSSTINDINTENMISLRTAVICQGFVQRY